MKQNYLGKKNQKNIYETSGQEFLLKQITNMNDCESDGVIHEDNECRIFFFLVN